MGTRRLKILTGPNRGGELLLPENGEISIGSDDACDLVLSDPSLAGRHALLRLNGQARLIPLEGTVSAGDVPLPGEGELIADFCVYSLGETQLSLGPDNGEWLAAPPSGEVREPDREGAAASPPPEAEPAPVPTSR